MKYPKGKINPTDEGALAVRMFRKDDVLIIDFGKPVKWLGLHLEEVRALRIALEKHEKDLSEP